MNKKLISMALTGVLAVGVLSVATPSVADARKTKPETSTDISVFFFNDTATTEIYTLSLHDALPI